MGHSVTHVDAEKPSACRYKDFRTDLSYLILLAVILLCHYTVTNRTRIRSTYVVAIRLSELRHHHFSRDQYSVSRKRGQIIEYESESKLVFYF